METWTSSQSGAGDANVYLQLNPMSAVEAAANVTVQVTYWATGGQGFTVQYDTPGNAYQNGPTVSSPGTGTWTTASVQLTGAQFDEAQNGGADLRLNVTNASAPLIVQSVTMSVTNSSGPTLSASPTSLSFGNQAVGSASAAQTVTVTNAGTASASLFVGLGGRPVRRDEHLRILTRGGRVLHGQRDVHAHRGRRAPREPVGGQQRRRQPADRGAVGYRHHLDDEPGAEPAGDGEQRLPELRASNVDRRRTPARYWESTDGAGYPQTITVDLGSVQSLGSVDPRPAAVAGVEHAHARRCRCSAPPTASSFSQLVGSAGYTFNPSTGNTVTISLPSGTSDQYVQLSFTGNTGWTRGPALRVRGLPRQRVERFRQRPDGFAVEPVVRQPERRLDQLAAVGHGHATRTARAVSMSSIGVTGPFDRVQQLRHLARGGRLLHGRRVVRADRRRRGNRHACR